jgi:hypothetical protein
MKHTLLTNTTYIFFGLIVALGIGLVHAAPFTDAGTTPPSGNVAVPVNTRADLQVKDGGLSVGAFAVEQDAYFDQQTFFKGVVSGGVPGSTSSTVALGSSASPVTVNVSGDVSAHGSIKSDSLKNIASPSLCATANGTIVSCQSVGSSTNPPTITELSNEGSVGGGRIEIFRIGSSVTPGNKYTLEVYSHVITVTASIGDNPFDIVVDLVSRINDTTTAQWNDHSSAPIGATGFPPVASAILGGNGDLFKVTLDYQHQFAANATVN